MAGLDVEIGGNGVVVLRFVNPPTGLLTAAMTVELEARLAQLTKDIDTRVLILTGGQPDVFVRHFDVGELAAAAAAVRATPPRDDAEWHSSAFHRITRCLETAPIPVLAAINGTCMGVGYELALACDIRLASAGDYPIGLPEVNIGVCPGGGGTVRLARLIGVDAALEMLFLGQTHHPEAAWTRGLVSRVVADALTSARSLADELTAKSRDALSAIKRVSRAGRDRDMESALTIEQRVVNVRMASGEMATLMQQMNTFGVDIRDLRLDNHQQTR